MYGAQHPIVLVPVAPTADQQSYVVVGHCCETSDIMTPGPGDPETVAERRLTSAVVGDLLVIEGAGAYCSAMSASNYNSFPILPEVLLRTDGRLRQIRRRQTLDEIIQLETE
jgi:diaminopimelate decarboxylase